MHKTKLHYLTQTPNKYLFDGCKLIYHQDKLLPFLQDKRITPIHIDIGIHKSCNIKCIYCYGIKQVPSPKYIPEDRLIHLAVDAAKSGVKSIAVIGDGEPTMNNGLYAFVQHAKHMGLDVSVATNGLLLDSEKIQVLTRNCTWLRFNVSAVDKYEYIMGAHKRAFKLFELIVKHTVKRKHNCTIGLQMVLIPECFSEVIPLAKKAIEWGVDYLVIKQFSDAGDGMPMNFNMDEYDRVTSDLRTVEEMSNARTRIVVKWSAIRDTREITKHRLWGFRSCIDLPFIFQISGDGGCYPCGYLFGNPDYCYGNVCSDRLKDILHSDRYWEVIEKVRQTKLDQLCEGQCRHCETNKFMDKLVAQYAITGALEPTLEYMCGGRKQYEEIMSNPPEHRNFV